MDKLRTYLMIEGIYKKKVGSSHVTTVLPSLRDCYLAYQTELKTDVV